MATVTHPLRYRAFISYSHRDSTQAIRLHRRLESYRLPRDLPLPNTSERHLRPVFLDREELASSGALSESLVAALDDAAALIVVCSPAAARSHWVQEEIRHFRTRHPDRPVLAFVVAGDPAADPRGATPDAAMPLALLLKDPAKPEGSLGDPLAADARPEADGFDTALLKTIAGLVGVRLDDLRRREHRRRQRQWLMVTSLSLLLTSFFAWLAFDAMRARDEARAAHARAELELQSEQQTRQFLLSVFQLADPEQNAGHQATVREVLDQAVARIDQATFSRPVIKSRYLASLGTAYAGLGLSARSLELLHASLRELPAEARDAMSRDQRIDVQTEIATVQFNSGDYPAAQAAIDAATRLRALGPADPARDGRLAIVLGDTLARSGIADQAREAYMRAMSYAGDAAMSIQDAARIRGQAEMGLAFLAFDAGDHDVAESRFAEAQALLGRELGMRHPLTLVAMISRASNAYAQGNRTLARAVWTEALAANLSIYDDDAPEVGTLQANLGLLEFEDGNVAEAERLFRAALASDRKHRSAQFDDLVYPLHNLAYTRLAQGDVSEALVLLEEALPIAERNQHPMLGAVLLALAEARCVSGATESGRAAAERGTAVVRDTLDPGHWRHQQAQLVTAYCRARSGMPHDSAGARAARAAIEARWPGKGTYALRARALESELD